MHSVRTRAADARASQLPGAQPARARSPQRLGPATHVEARPSRQLGGEGTRGDPLRPLAHLRPSEHLVAHPSAVSAPIERGDHAGRSVLGIVGRGLGRPLPASLAASMGARLGADFSDVRIHTDAQAARSASVLSARAYTVNNEVVFADGAFAPDTAAGRHTLAHELTHVLQQRAGAVSGADDGSGIALSDPADSFERQAELTASRILSEPPAHAASPPNGARRPTALQTWASATLTPARAAGGPIHRPVVQRENVYGSGYLQPANMRTDAQQIAGTKATKPGDKWFPASEDFVVTAAGGPGAKTMAELRAFLAGKAVGSISDLKIIGHASGTAGGILGLAGRIDGPPNADVWFDAADGNLDQTSASSLAPFKDRFAKGASVTLVGCDSATGDELMTALANALGVCVNGYTVEIAWCLDSAGNRVTGRGKTEKLLIDPLGNVVPTGCGSTIPSADKAKCPSPTTPAPATPSPSTPPPAAPR